MNSENENVPATTAKTQLKESLRRTPLIPLCFASNVGPSPGRFKSPHLKYVQGSMDTNSPRTPKFSPSCVSLPGGCTRHLTPVTQCYSDKPHISTYSSTPVKRPKTLEKKHYSFLTPISSKACLPPRTLNMKERTPLSKTAVYNPFDRCPERLKYSSVSPSMFKEVVSPNDKDASAFSWAIDHIAILHPASIENSPYNQAELPIDPEFEAKAQEAIDKFFSKAVLPSPWTNSPAPPVNLLSLMSTTDNARMSIGASPALMSAKTLHKCRAQHPLVESRTVWTQSEITLPPILPKEVEDMLSSFCTFTADQKEQAGNEHPSLNSTSLRRKLQFSTEDLTLTSLLPIFNEDSDDEYNISAKSISPIPLEDFDDDAFPWDSQPAFRLCNLCSEAKLTTCVHATPIKLRSSSAGMSIRSPNLSLILCEDGSNGAESRSRLPNQILDSPSMSPIMASPNLSAIKCEEESKSAQLRISPPSVSPIMGLPDISLINCEGNCSPEAELVITSPNVSPIAMWLKKRRKRNHSEEILSGTTAGNFESDLPPRRVGRNLPLSLPAVSSVVQMEDESQFSPSFSSVIATACNPISDCKMSDSLCSPISLKKSNSSSEHTFVTFIEDEYPPNAEFNFTNNIHLSKDTISVGKAEETMAVVDDCRDRNNFEMTATSNESRSMFMDVDSTRFENIYSNETNHSQDTGYQTGSFQPSYSSGLEQKIDSIEMEMMKAKVNEQFPNIFGSFNFNNKES